jgi:DNA-binding response OmpR family regulator
MLRAAPRVLVVDDDLPICELVELALSDEGWDVQTRTHAQDALAFLQQLEVDVILLDLRMPDMDAEASLATWRRQATRDIPILLLSAAPNLPEHATRLGAHSMLAKPFDLDELCMTVRHLVVQGQTVSVADGAPDGR